MAAESGLHSAARPASHQSLIGIEVDLSQIRRRQIEYRHPQQLVRALAHDLGEGFVAALIEALPVLEKTGTGSASSTDWTRSGDR